jgi:hypothetical protein
VVDLLKARLKSSAGEMEAHSVEMLQKTWKGLRDRQFGKFIRRRE